ncbi:MAG: hypothetical protein PUB37_09275 [Firmicutes bacterium]|nr:hypothetical protein [Bacillota bacterium]
MKTITFKCKNKDSEIINIIVCILLFIVGWLLSSAIARSIGDSLGVTVLIPVAFLVCGVVMMSKRKNQANGEGTAQFSKSGKVKLTFGGRSAIFECRDVKNVYYTRDTMTNDAIGNSYVMVIKLPFKSYRLFSENSDGGGFEDTELYAVYLELKKRIGGSDEQSE